MKHIELKRIDLVRPGGTEEVLDYKDLIVIAMRTPMDPKAGIGLDEMRGSNRVLDAIEKANGSGLDLEDADYAFMCKKVIAMRFSFADKAFEQFVDDVIGVK